MFKQIDGIPVVILYQLKRTTMKKLLTILTFVVIAIGNNTVKAQDSDIVSLAVENDNLTTLVAAIKAAGLVETLQGDGPFTVFAPTNEAFAALPEGTLESLLKPENKDQLVAILTYHVVGAEVQSADLKDGQNAATVNGANVTVDKSKKGVKINDASVIAADVQASNGVVHVIDKVILPPKK